MLYKGRKKIVSSTKSEDLMDFQVVADLINRTMGEHNLNRNVINYLIDYKNGRQTILDKKKIVRDEINNKLVMNHAQMITRTVVGYFLGTPIQYIQAGDTDKKEEIDLLNKYVQFEDKASVDKEIGEMQSITGTAYRIIYTDGIYADEVPFEERSLHPANTYVVYENSISEKPLVGVHYYEKYNEKGEFEGKVIYAYTEFGVWEIITDNSGAISDTSIYSYEPYNVGGVPIIEYPNNQWRIGDWELCIGLMDAINALHSGRLDDIDQIVQSLLVFINADIDGDGYKEMREQGVVLLKNNSGHPSSVEMLQSTLDQTGMNMFAEELEKMLYSLIGIPDRNNRGGGGGDTGQAVELRDGWADLEVVARNKELSFKRSEKQALKIILNILNNSMATELSLVDIDIKFTRNKNNNLMVKVQAYAMLLGTKTISPADCLTIVDLVSDVNEYVSRGEEFWGASFAGLEQANMAVEMSAVALDTAKNPPPEDTGTNPTGKQGGARAQVLKEDKKMREATKPKVGGDK